MIEKAIENLAAARDCLRRKQFNAAANRAYYSMYHAAVYALDKTGVSNARADGRWQHGTVRRAFNLRLGPVGSGLFPERCFQYLDTGYSIRIKADYRPDNVQIEEAVTLVDWSDDMLQIIREKL